ERMAQASWWMRMRVPAGLVALAACVLIAFGIAFHNRAGSPQLIVHIGPDKQPAGPAPVMLVEGPTVDLPQGAVVSEITVEAGGSYAKDSSLSPYADEIDNRPARVVIASGINPNQPPAVFPY
ncbi:MAG TPA: hypothetical protein VLJ39_14310, partial [Tepidisphaeraceae bacterium]|nr:hypothetical protein [Tepidisphaeraceae bacterium]